MTVSEHIPESPRTVHQSSNDAVKKSVENSFELNGCIRQFVILGGELSFVSISGVDERLRCGRFDRVEQPLQRPDPRHLHRRGELDGAPAPLLLQEHLCWV